MRIGKISENVLKRSVLKILENKKSNNVSAAVTADCAYFANEDSYVTSSVNTFTEDCEDAAYFAMHSAANNLYLSGARPVMASLGIVLGIDHDESVLKHIMKNARLAADELGITIAGGHTEVSDTVSKPVITVCVTGSSSREPQKAEAKSGEYIIMTKYAGIIGSSILAKECREKLSERLPMHLIEKASGFSNMVSVKKDYEIGSMSGARCFHDVSGGGIFAALWEMSVITSKGLDVDIKKIPLKQETIEITNNLMINPYQLLSGGSLLMLTDDPKKVLEAYKNAGIPASVIGRITDNNDKIIRNEDEIRFLDKPQMDEIHKLGNLPA